MRKGVLPVQQTVVSKSTFVKNWPKTINTLYCAMYVAFRVCVDDDQLLETTTLGEIT